MRVEGDALPDPKHRRRPQLDGLRAVAVTIVVVHHAIEPLSFGGWFGVDVFFVLSGFLITSILLRDWTRAGTLSIPTFYIRRLLRLYPALLATLIVMVPFSLWLEGGNPLRTLLFAAIGGTYTANLAMTVQDGNLGWWTHLWSLAMEEQFYLVWPVILLFLLRRRVPRTKLAVGLAGYAVLAIVVSVIAYKHGGHNFDPIGRSQGLALGCLLAVVMRSAAGAQWVSARSAVLAVVGWLGLLGIVVVATITTTGEQFFVPVASLVSLALIASLAAPGAEDRGVGRPLSWRPVVYVGELSYAIYLWHFPLLALFRNTDLPRPLGVSIALALTLLAAVASRHIVEAPFLRLKDRLGADSAAAERQAA